MMVRKMRLYRRLNEIDEIGPSPAYMCIYFADGSSSQNFAEDSEIATENGKLTARYIIYLESFDLQKYHMSAYFKKQ